LLPAYHGRSGGGYPWIERQRCTIKVFIKVPFAGLRPLLRHGFWQASGIACRYADGVKLRTESLAAFLKAALRLVALPQRKRPRRVAVDTAFLCKRNQWARAMRPAEAEMRLALVPFISAARYAVYQLGACLTCTA